MHLTHTHTSVTRTFYRAPGGGANGRRCRPFAPRPGKEAVAVHLFRVAAQFGETGKGGEREKGGMLGPAPPAWT
jgi:hypothetical protein